ncbi:MAG: chorismate synthase [Candidatus Omnitrophica bacterium]|nr:chorismate synthase [Candidatus Omnitrophota bacterium]
MLRYLTAGESHGECLIAVLEGMPAGLALAPSFINGELRRRQLGYGRGARMTSIEADEAQILSGVRFGKTIGSPIALKVDNKDSSIDRLPVVTRPRPGHADLGGALKYNTGDIRNILERASARETAARVAVGAVAKRLLQEFGIEVFSHVVRLGGVDAEVGGAGFERIRSMAELSPLRCADRRAEERMIRLIDRAKASGDTVGGTVEVVALGVPVGLGSHVHYDRKLDGRLAGALMSIQAIKAVEVGAGTRVSQVFGSQLHDQIYYSKGKGFYRKSFRAGGIEGGISIGGPVIVRVHMKPLSTLRRPLMSVDIKAKKPFQATVERSDVSAVPAAGVVAEAVMAFELGRAFLEKFGGDSLGEVRRNFRGYLRQVKQFSRGLTPRGLTPLG